jgi:hypothetical protein
MWSIATPSFVAARQDTFDGIFEGADRLIANATPSGTAGLERDEEATWKQTQVLLQGKFDLADKLSEAAGFRYKARHSMSRTWELDTWWYPDHGPTSGFEERRSAI